jgi:hypothetical protein
MGDDYQITRPDARASPDWFARVLGISQVVVSIAVVVLGAYLVHRQGAYERTATRREQAAERSAVARSEGRAVARAYAVQLRQVARGVTDMLFCKEKLEPFAEGEGTRVSFQDLKRLGAVLNTAQLTKVQRASNELDKLYRPGYSAPASGSVAAYRAWMEDEDLRSRAQRAGRYLAAALPALGGVPPKPGRCNHR